MIIETDGLLQRVLWLLENNKYPTRSAEHTEIFMNNIFGKVHLSATVRSWFSAHQDIGCPLVLWRSGKTVHITSFHRKRLSISHRVY